VKRKSSTAIFSALSDPTRPKGKKRKKGRGGKARVTVYSNREERKKSYPVGSNVFAKDGTQSQEKGGEKERRRGHFSFMHLALEKKKANFSPALKKKEYSDLRGPMFSLVGKGRMEKEKRKRGGCLGRMDFRFGGEEEKERNLRLGKRKNSHRFLLWQPDKRGEKKRQEGIVILAVFWKRGKGERQFSFREGGVRSC